MARRTIQKEVNKKKAMDDSAKSTTDQVNDAPKILRRGQQKTPLVVDSPKAIQKKEEEVVRKQITREVTRAVAKKCDTRLAVESKLDISLCTN